MRGGIDRGGREKSLAERELGEERWAEGARSLGACAMPGAGDLLWAQPVAPPALSITISAI